MREQQPVPVNGLTLSYVVDGPESGPPLVLLHGHGDDVGAWFTVMDDLARDHRVHALDMRGHGASQWASEYSIELFADDLDGFVTALGLDEVTVVGHSMGGCASVVAAMRQPSWLAALVLEDTPMPTPGWLTRDTPPRPENPGNDWDGMAAKLNDQLVNPNPQWWDRLAGVAVPTLVIAGGDVSPLPQSNVAGVNAMIPDCRVETIPVGHDIHAAEPDRFLKALRAFLSDRR